MWNDLKYIFSLERKLLISQDNIYKMGTRLCGGNQQLKVDKGF